MAAVAISSKIDGEWKLLYPLFLNRYGVQNLNIESQPKPLFMIKKESKHELVGVIWHGMKRPLSKILKF